MTSWIRVFPILLLVLSSTLTIASAQSFQPRSARGQGGVASRPSQSGNSAQASPSVSSDLLQIYTLTKTAASELEVTAIARSCSNIVSDQKRSQADRDYAASLLAWGLNRRGEMRSEQAAALVAKGMFAEAAKLDKYAADDFSTAVQFGPDNWRIRHNLAIALAMKTEYAQAIEQFSQAIELKPDYPNAYFNRAELHFELQDYASAIADYTQAIELNASDPQYHNSRGHARFLLESYPEALADYRRAVELGADSAAYMTDLADAYQFVGEWEGAAKAYRAALKLNAKLPRAYQNVAWLMATCPDAKLRNAELAITAAKKAVELDGGGMTPELLDVLASATAASGNFPEAVRLQTQAVSASSDADERDELQHRLQLYRNRRAYVQAEKDSSQRSTITVSASAGASPNR